MLNSLWQAPALALGFRPFFLMAGLSAVTLMPLWSLAYARPSAIQGYLAGPLWHGHEMIFGFAGAVIAGFLLTAVPNWTGVPGHKGRTLAGLAALWLAGRIVVYFNGSLPWPLVMLVDVSFLPTLAAAITPALVRTRNYRNLGIPPLLLGAALVNFLIHWDARQGGMMLANAAMQAAMDVVVVLIVFIGGRVVPFFTQNALREPVRGSNWTDRWSLYAVLAVAVLDLAAGMELAAGFAALAATLVNALRMRGWRSFATRHQPILWILHLGYVWVVAGLTLKAISSFSGAVPWTLAIHGLTAGAIGTFTLGMMSRVALGHTGRPLHVKPAIVAAYVSVNLGAMLRILAPFIVPASSSLIGVHVAGALWASAFLLFVLVYTPILTTQRIDGRPG